MPADRLGIQCLRGFGRAVQSIDLGGQDEVVLGWPSLSAMSATALTKAIASLKFLNLKVRRIAFPSSSDSHRCTAARRRSASSRPSGGTPPSHGTHRRDARSSIGEYVPPPNSVCRSNSIMYGLRRDV